MYIYLYLHISPLFIFDEIDIKSTQKKSGNTCVFLLHIIFTYFEEYFFTYFALR